MANNELLRFRKGTHANLKNQDIVAGTVYVTTDEKAMYVDISATERIRLGQIVNFATLTEFQNFLNNTIPPYSEEAFYYVEDKNALLKWVSNDNTTSVGGVDTKGTWKQINSTSAVTEAINGVSNRVTALEGTVGNASTGLVKDVNALKSTVGDANSGLVKDVATNAADIDTLEEAIVTGENAKEGTIGKLVTQIGADLDVAEGEIDALQTLTNGHTATIGEHTTAIGNLNTALTNYKTEVGNTYATKTELANEKKALQAEIDSDVAAEAELRVQGDEANANAISAINTKIGNAESGMVADIARAQATADGAVTAIGDANSGLTKEVNARVKTSDFEAFKITNTEAIGAVEDKADAAQQAANAADANAEKRVLTSTYNAFLEVNTQNIADAKAAGTTAQTNLTNYINAHADDYDNDKIDELIEGVNSSANTNAAAIKKLGEDLTAHANTAEQTYAKIGDSYLKSETYTKTEADGAIDAKVAAEAKLRDDQDKIHTEAINGIKATIGDSTKGLIADIAAAKAAGDNAQIDFDAWEQAHLNDYTNSQIDAAIKVAKDAADAAQGTANANTQSINGLTATVEKLDGTETTEGSVKQQIAAAKKALQDEIDADIRAANAMEFEKGVSASSELPTSAKNGATCVAKASFTLAGGEQVRPGDLLIATGTEDATTGLITNPSWTLVHTGYDASLEQTLDTVDGKIALTSKVGGTASTVSFVAATGSAATVSVANNTVTVGIEWDNF